MALTTTSCTVTELMTAARGSVVFLGALLRSADGPPPGELHELAAEILRCCNRALAALSAGGVANAAGGGAKKRKMEHGATTALPVRVGGEEAPRKVVKSRTIEDGFIWRKYGQKEIRNYNYPRLYFRCTYKHDQACKAARQVQQSQEDPSLYVITYFGEHTCREEAMDEEGSQRFIIDFGSRTPRTTDRHGDSPFSEVTHEQPSYAGEVRGETSWGWPLEEHELDARLQGVAGIEEATPAASWPNGCYTSPGLESLGSCLGSEPGVGFFDFGDLVTFDQIDLFQ